MKTLEQVRKGILRAEEIVPSETVGLPVVQDLHSRFGKVLTGMLIKGKQRIPVCYSFAKRVWVDSRNRKYSGVIINHI